VRSSAERAEAAVAALVASLDHRSPMTPTLLLAARRLGLPADTSAALDFWSARSPGSLVSEARYRWELNHARAPDATYCPPIDEWTPWRPRDARVMSAEGRPRFEQRFTLPISIADGGALLASLEDPRAATMLLEAEPVFRRDLAEYVQAKHAFKDLFALHCLARRPAMLERMHPFAIAIASCYTTDARRDGAVRGKRFPFHDVPLVSTSAMLAGGLLALGIDTDLVAILASHVAERSADAGWSDAPDDDPDVLTTLLAAELLARIDPSFDPAPAVAHLERAQRRDGTFRALGPEVPWLTDAAARFLRDAALPFARRFRFPHLSGANRDHKTGLPFYAYFMDLARLFGALPGLAAAPAELAFLDLAGFRAFNNAHGQDLGDAVLKEIARALDDLPESVAIRDGGDEFLVVGAPGARLEPALRSFRGARPQRFRDTFGDDAPPVVARILLGRVPGRRLRDAREHLGRAVGALKHRERELGRVGLFEDLGDL